MAGAVAVPSLDEIRETRERIAPYVDETPVWRWRGPEVERRLGPQTEAVLKLELFQRAGSFKPRGALAVMLDLDEEALERGVTAVSAGNHAMAVGYAAGVLGTSAKVVMPRNANPARVAGCQAYGAEVVLADDVASAFRLARALVESEGRTFVHPFEGPGTARGTATLGLELFEQVRGELDAVLVPIGGGGLCAGVATALRHLDPRIEVFGIEPVGADSMHRSFAAGAPRPIEAVRTIADSLGAPYAEPYSFALCQRAVHELVLVDDDQLRDAMAMLFQHARLAVEPAGAAATAALLGPLRDRLAGRRVGVIVCGSNIDPGTFARLLAGGGL